MPILRRGNFSAAELISRLDEQEHQVVNRRVSEDTVLDIGENEQIVGIEIQDASHHLKLDKLLPVEYAVLAKAA